jgi:hypothetical protein
MIRPTLLVSAMMLLPCLASGKRIAPPKVEPVIYEGVRYLAPNDDGRRAYIEAWEVQTNKKLWDLTVFTNPIDPEMEEDVQWVFINRLSVRDSILFVTSERGNTYQVDPHTKEVRRSDPASSRTPSATAPPNEIPESVTRAIANGSLAKEYEVSLQVSPFFLRGDFNGDGKIDVAVLVKQRSTGKRGIAVIHGGTDKVTILGAGTIIGNGGDDLDWMDNWQVKSKSETTNRTSGPKLRGDALFVSKSEAASALIYWKGKRYVWSQQGD